MAARYTPVTLAEFTELLKAEKGWRACASERCNEHVFDFPIGGRWTGIVVRVYTSVAGRNNEGRACGQDAIRVCAVDTVNDKGVVKTARIHRTQNWRKNLQARVLAVIETAKKNMAVRESMGQWTRPTADTRVVASSVSPADAAVMSNFNAGSRREAAPTVYVPKVITDMQKAVKANLREFVASNGRTAPLTTIHDAFEATRRADFIGGRDEDEFAPLNHNGFPENHYGADGEFYGCD